MPSQFCASCSGTIPLMNYCPDCGRMNPDVAIPSPMTDPETLTAHLSTVAGKADHETVSFDALRTDYEKYERPLGDYLFEREQPAVIVESSGAIVEDYEDRTWKITPSFRQSGHFVATDERVFVLLPRDGSDSDIPDSVTSYTADHIVPVDYSSVVTVERNSGWRKDRIQLGTVDGYIYKIDLSGLTDEELTETIEIVRELSHEHDSADSRAARFIQDVDDAVAEGETAESLLREVADLFADRDEETIFDSAVAEADSLDELLIALQSFPGMVTDSGDAGDSESEIKESEDTALTTQPQVGNLQQQLSHTLKHADPADVGKYTIAAGIGFGAYAVSAPFSTIAGLTAIAAGGAITGAYASSHPNSFAARIDPITLATRARVQGEKWRSRSIGNGGAGAALGAIEYIAEEEMSPEYAHWIAGADIDMIRQGVEFGVHASEMRDDINNTATAAVLGGGVGLAYGYMDNHDQLDDLERLLDDDLYDSMDLQELGDDGQSQPKS